MNNQVPSDFELEQDLLLVIWIAAMMICSCVLLSGVAIVVASLLGRGI